MTTICGHDRETLRWALGLAIEIDQGKTRVVLHETRCGWASRNEAWGDIHDHAKLAAIIAELMRVHGLRAFSEPYASNDVSEYWIIVTEYADPAMRLVINFFRRVPNTLADTWHKYLSMPQARTFALALLDAPTTTAQDIERMIGEL